MSLRFIAIAGGIFASFWIFGLLQEKLFKGTFGPDGETFTFVMSLIFVSSLVNLAYAYIMMKIQKIQSDVHVPAVYQFSISLTYLLAMTSSFLALQWVSYPAQVLAKSAKPIPVLVMGVLLGNKSYHIARYLMVLLIVMGVGLFMYKDDKAASSEIGFGMGELLLILSLVMDGLTNSLQERVMSKHSIKSEQFMFDINQAALLLLGISLVYTGEAFKFVSFLNKYPIVLLQVGGVALCSALGQFCIYKCITEFGTLTCSIITTTRKFFTVLSSIIIFGHVLKGRQWFAILLVFTGLLLDIYHGKSSKKNIQK
uniref:Solute carrier family 35 member B1 n=2 Tax=Lygus hesperus TaxID=30085 RepID=A0A0A9WP37_LYGHE